MAGSAASFKKLLPYLLAASTGSMNNLALLSGKSFDANAFHGCADRLSRGRFTINDTLFQPSAHKRLAQRNQRCAPHFSMHPHLQGKQGRPSQNNGFVHVLLYQFGRASNQSSEKPQLHQLIADCRLLAADS
jgi:hypothetical protein